jgi:hypothetical protein|tara:strand:- start:7938 stop:8183 length:246 start_codon:yes stop_codon:yes gene_type:complete
MIITIKNDSGEKSYDTSKIEDNDKSREASIIISKTTTLEVLLEALNFTSQTHRSNLEKLLGDCPESEVTETDVEEDSSDED